MLDSMGRMSIADEDLRSKVISYLVGDVTLDELDDAVVEASFTDDRDRSWIQDVAHVIVLKDGLGIAGLRRELSELVSSVRIGETPAVS